MSIVHLLKVGDYFAFDAGTYRDGDVLYAEVLEVRRHLCPSINRVGRGSGGYKVLVHCSVDPAQGTLDGVEDHYGWYFVNRKCARLSSEQMRRAQEAGWPAERAFLHALLGSAEPPAPAR
jgi:hypothetical protein